MKLKKHSVANPLVMLFACVLIFISANPSFAAMDRARQAGLVPHKALYEIKLASKKSGAQVVNISGKMFYDWQPSCDAWISNNRFDLIYEYADAPPVRVSSDFSTYESFDGKIFNFTSQRKTNGELFEELRGSGTTDGKISEAVYSIPEDLVFNLPEGSLFPMAHTLDVLDKIHSGKKFYNVTVFDGSDKQGPVEVNTFIGKPAVIPDSLKNIKDIDQTLLNSKAWNTRLAFFPLSKPESQADYEMDIVFHENGIISDMMIDYGSFSVSQKLKAVEILGDACNPGVKTEVPAVKEQ